MVSAVNAHWEHGARENALYTRKPKA